MKTKVFALLPLLLMVLAAPPASAQGRDKAWYCAADKMTGLCDGQAACDQAWAEHLRRYHGGDPSLIPLTPTRPRTPGGVLIGIITASTATGALLGSLGTREGVNQWQNGGIGGFDVGLVLGAAATSNRIPVVVGAAMSTAGGAIAGKQAGDYQVSQGKEETNKRDIKIGAAAGFATWAISKLTIGPASPNLAPRWMGPNGTLNFIFTGRSVGMTARW